MQHDLMVRWKAELAHLREETKKQKKILKKQIEEITTLKKLLESFKEKNEKQVKIMQEQMGKMHEMEDKIDQLEEEIRVLTIEKKNLEAALKDEVARRKDAEYALEKTQEQLKRKTDEYDELDVRFTEAQESTYNSGLHVQYNE